MPTALVNRIAAGECVERPASVVKELVENAIDAGATRIDVWLDDGGRERIEVRDDGCGMDAEDLALCVASHATSKLVGDDDLFEIRTLGFRGEALPSIASVSRLMITSRVRESDVGHSLRVEGGDEAAGPHPTAAGPGTTVAVRDLFYNVPARRKFLRTNATETGHVMEQLARLALPHPEVAFKLTVGGRTALDLPMAPDRRRRIGDFYGQDLAEGLIEIGREGQGVSLQGWVAPPALCRKTNKWEYVFVNGRYVRDRFVSHAVREAYRSLIQKEYPVAFLFLTIDPADVDVNVHPMKTEVRWRDSNFMHHFVLAAIRDKFLGTNLDRPFRVRAAQQDENAERVRSAMVEFFTQARPAMDPAAAFAGAAPMARRAESGAIGVEEWLGRAAPDATSTLAPREGTAVAESGPTLNDRAAPLDQMPRRTEATGAALIVAEPARGALQAHRTYIVVEEAAGITIIDQHALHERILYEELRARVALKPLESQRLLLPDVLTCPADRLAAIELHAETLARLGIELSIAGPGSVAVQAFPTLLQRADRIEFVRELLDLLSEGGTRVETESVIHHVLDMAACKAAVKAGDPLTAEEIAALLARRDLAERSSHCPHGRPTTLHLSLADLERQFKRRT
ncbi:MAG: DNA mismatch repair endonuclease MutL [Phycisphaerae bacterium]|nr:DNA mismatch repair endonuclease MutL [Phycisphaerae bacterium]